VASQIDQHSSGKPERGKHSVCCTKQIYKPQKETFSKNKNKNIIIIPNTKKNTQTIRKTETRDSACYLFFSVIIRITHIQTKGMAVNTKFLVCRKRSVRNKTKIKTTLKKETSEDRQIGSKVN